MKLFEVEGHVPQCFIAGDANDRSLVMTAPLALPLVVLV